MGLPSSCHGVLEPRYYRFVGTFSSKHPGGGGSRGVVLLIPRVWKKTPSSGELEIGISCFTGPHLGTGGQKHTHTLITVDDSVPPASQNTTLTSQGRELTPGTISEPSMAQSVDELKLPLYLNLCESGLR